MNAPTHDPYLEPAILAAISKQSDIRLAILFGSLAAAAGRTESDLDLAVDAGRRLTGSENNGADLRTGGKHRPAS